MAGGKGFGFGDDADDADTAEFISDTTGDESRGNGDGRPRDDGSDNAGWDQTTDVKDLAGAGKDPGAEDDDDKPGDKTDEEPAAAAALKKAAEKPKDGDDDNDDDPKDGELPPAAMKRVARANRARDREAARAVAAETEAAELRKKLETKDKPADAAPPKAEDFDDYEDYLQAKKDHETKPAPKVEEKKPDETTTQKPDREVVDAVAEVKAILTEAGHEGIFTAIVEAGEKVPVPRDVVLALADPDAFGHPESVLQALLDNPERAVDLAKMKPAARMKHLLTFDQPYKAPAKSDKDKPAPKLSEAPPPFEETNGSAAGSKNYDAMPFEEFEKVRNAESAKTKDFW